MATPSVLELHVAELRQLFNAMDPAPFRERDLDPNAEKYIVDWAREHFRQQASSTRLRLRQLDRLSEMSVRLLDAKPQARAA